MALKHNVLPCRIPTPWSSTKATKIFLTWSNTLRGRVLHAFRRHDVGLQHRGRPCVLADGLFMAAIYTARRTPYSRLFTCRDDQPQGLEPFILQDPSRLELSLGDPFPCDPGRPLMMRRRRCCTVVPAGMSLPCPLTPSRRGMLSMPVRSHQGAVICWRSSSKATYGGSAPLVDCTPTRRSASSPRLDE